MLGERQRLGDRGLGVVGDEDQRVLLAEGVEAAARLDQGAQRGVGMRDRVDGLRGPSRCEW